MSLGKQNGQGQFNWSQDANIEIMMDGVKVKWPNNYKGEWKDNKMHGSGILTNPKIGIYKGAFKEDKMDGEGK